MISRCLFASCVFFFFFFFFRSRYIHMHISIFFKIHSCLYSGWRRKNSKFDLSVLVRYPNDVVTNITLWLKTIAYICVCVCVYVCVCNACVYMYVYECENKASETYRNFNINSKEKASLLILKLTIHPPSGVIYHVHQYLQTRFLPIFHPLFFSLTSSTKLSTKSASDDYESLTIRDRLSSRRY